MPLLSDACRSQIWEGRKPKLEAAGGPQLPPSGSRWKGDGLSQMEGRRGTQPPLRFPYRSSEETAAVRQRKALVVAASVVLGAAAIKRRRSQRHRAVAGERIPDFLVAPGPFTHFSETGLA